MKKIPTVFVRDFDNQKFVIDQITTGCEWVLAGEGVPTRKFDGTCVLIRRDGVAIHGFARREVKPDKAPPAGFVLVDTDPLTGKRVGWEPIEQSGFAKFFAEAIESVPAIVPGTYELIGPKINKNPDGVDAHYLMPHGDRLICIEDPLTFEGLRTLMGRLAAIGVEGVVWHHPDGRMAKLKTRDFPL